MMAPDFNVADKDVMSVMGVRGAASTLRRSRRFGREAVITPVWRRPGNESLRPLSQILIINQLFRPTDRIYPDRAGRWPWGRGIFSPPGTRARPSAPWR